MLSSMQQPQNESALFSSERVLNILKLILAGSPLPEVLTIVARLVESQGEGTICTIWLPDEDGKQLHCAAAPSLAGFSAHVGPTLVGPKGCDDRTQAVVL
jgi:formate hydrogenlyase transcriptional activator